jgi:serine/threonine protein kinase
MSELIGRNLGQYRIVEQIAVGGMATVYKAFQPSLDRYVAVKVLHNYHAQQPGFAERFDQEAKSVAKLVHPHVLPIYEYGTEQDIPFLVTQYVEAGTLDSLLTQPLDLHQATDIIEQIADALQCAHDMGIVHRDIKPSNVLMDRGHWVLLSDFGLAKIIGVSGVLSGSGIGVGTPTYMAPEQGQGLDVDHRADLYSLGVILYEMTTGMPPFNADNAVAVVFKHVMEPLILPRVVNPDIPDAVERVILKAMAKEPEDRYQTATEMARALRLSVGSQPNAISIASPPTKAETSLKPEAPGLNSGTGPSAETMPSHLQEWWMRWRKAFAAATVLAIFLFAAILLFDQLKQSRSTAAAGETEEVPSTAEAVRTILPQTVPPSPPALNAAAPPITAESDQRTRVTIDAALTYAQSHPPILEDDFDNPSSGWQQQSDQQAARAYVDGTYVIQVPSSIGQRNQVNVPLPLEAELTDFVLEMNLKVDSGLGSASGMIGFRTRGADSLFAGLSAHPCQAFIGDFRAGEEEVLAHNTSCGWLADARSNLTLVAVGGDIALLVNGDQRVTAQTRITSPGTLHLLVSNANGEEVVLRVERVRVWDLTPLTTPAAP